MTLYICWLFLFLFCFCHKRRVKSQTKFFFVDRAWFTESRRDRLKFGIRNASSFSMRVWEKPKFGTKTARGQLHVPIFSRTISRSPLHMHSPVLSHWFFCNAVYEVDKCLVNNTRYQLNFDELFTLGQVDQIYLPKETVALNRAKTKQVMGKNETQTCAPILVHFTYKLHETRQKLP